MIARVARFYGWSDRQIMSTNARRFFWYLYEISDLEREESQRALNLMTASQSGKGYTEMSKSLGGAKREEKFTGPTPDMLLMEANRYSALKGSVTLVTDGSLETQLKARQAQDKANA